MPPLPLITHLHHTGILVDDLDRSVAFYQGTLGLTLHDRRPFRSVELAFLGPPDGGTTVELIAGGERHGHDGVVEHVAFAVGDFDAAVARLGERGVVFTTPEPIPIWDDRRILFFRGPDGELLELVEQR
jgi:lactoylglutathione lyase